MNWWKKPFFAACALALILAVCSSSPILADEPVQPGHPVQYGADNLPPDPSTLQPMPPESPREQALSATKEKFAAKVAELVRLREQNRISDEEWRAGILSIKEEVDAFKREAGWAAAAGTTDKLSSESLEVTTASLDRFELPGMHFYNQTRQCANGCGVASSKEVLDFQNYAYGSPYYSFNTISQHLGLTCCPEGIDCPGVCLASHIPSIENTLEALGTAFQWDAVQPGLQSTWFGRVVMSVTMLGEPQVQYVHPNWDGPNGVALDGWEGLAKSLSHYIAVSGYDSTIDKVRYQESAWWTAADKWLKTYNVWSANYEGGTDGSCAGSNKLIY
jgi:hypothetical protein